MTDIIHLLPDSVANQIAAGEVVQRPSSIIKEMVENAIDAHATSIQVLVTDGGKTCVQVIDNGIGMSETDARMSFERHATSKIKSAADLYTLTTMGFRGEALASIAAVSQVELRTRRKEDEIGICLQISGSKVDKQEPVMCPVGSNFLVKNLFYNVPARRKFLKSNQTELTNVVTDFERIALVYPDLSFTLQNNGTDIYKLEKCSLRKRIVDIFGKKINSALLPLEAETSLVKISGYIGSPESARKKGAKQFFFVNGRYMRHPYFHSAVAHAYEELITPGEHVSYFIYFSVDASTIDVNVHPTKTEIKFDNEQPIWQLLFAVVREAVGKFVNAPTIDFDVEDKPNIPTMGIESTTASMPQPRTVDYNPFKVSADSEKRNLKHWDKLYGGLENFDTSDGKPFPRTGSLVDSQDEHMVRSLLNIEKTTSVQQTTLWHSHSDNTNSETDNVFNSVAENPHFQYKGRFIVTPISSGLLLVDQHRAHTRILYEEYLQSLKDKKHASQKLIFPVLVDLSVSEDLAITNLLNDFESLGFELSNLGNGSYSISSVPAGIEGLDPARLLHDLLYVATETGMEVKEKVSQSIALGLARSVSIVYGQVLTDKEMKDLLEQLFSLDSPMRTPDGKIVFSILEHANIERMFS